MRARKEFMVSTKSPTPRHGLTLAELLVLMVVIGAVTVGLGSCVRARRVAPEATGQPALGDTTQAALFATELRRIRAAIEVGVPKEEFRARVIELVATSDESPRATAVIEIYKDSAQLWDMFENDPAGHFWALDGSCLWLRRDFYQRDPEERPRSTAEKDFFKTVYALALKYPEIVLEKTPKGWRVSPAPWVVLWGKAAAM